MEKKFGLIGKTVGHSFSKNFFDEKFFRDGLRDYHYDLYALKNIDELKTLLKDNPELCGLNVTIPYKEQVLSLLNEVDETAKTIGAVNVIKIEGQKLKGFNTDYDAFLETLQRWLPTDKKFKALILGTGGSSKAVKVALKKLDIEFEMVSRNEGHTEHTYESLKKNPKAVETTNLIINTTPLGMSPDTESFPPIPYDALESHHYVYDLIYNPARTLFLQKAEMRNAHIKNGLEMLHVQAEKSWAIWSN
jgi:shikimate dehydrogenase